MSHAPEEVRLTEDDAGPDPIALFARWFEEAREAEIYLHEAMTLATASADGRPSARLVLLKEFGADGFVFFTNYDSRKAAELDANPHAALVLHWAPLHRQVRIEGRVHRTTPEASAAYFSTRPRGSRIAAWASKQSARIADRVAIEEEFHRREQEFGDGEVPLPPFWGGYVVVPERIEFWQGRANRMHDRLVYTRGEAGEAGEWSISRLSP